MSATTVTAQEARCAVCDDTGEASGDGMLDCRAPGCNAAITRAELNRHMSFALHMSPADRDWAVFQYAQKQAQAEGVLRDGEEQKLARYLMAASNYIDTLGGDSKRYRQAVAGVAQWVPISDSAWVNIVNHERAYEGWEKDDIINHVFKLTEAKCKELNCGAVPAPSPTAVVAVPQPIYERKRTAHGGGWVETTIDGYNAQADWNRRIVYAAPQPAAAPSGDVERGLYSELLRIQIAMEHMGDQLNNMDVVEEDDEKLVTPGFDALNRLLAITATKE